MKIRTFMVGCALALALLLFAQHHEPSIQPSGFHAVMDLTHTINPQVPTYELTDKPVYQARTVATIDKDGYFARDISLPEHFGTHLDAPAHFARPEVDHLHQIRVQASFSQRFLKKRAMGEKGTRSDDHPVEPMYFYGLLHLIPELL